jgi:endonuclease/exonuclease/phosphatase family metal-dependent hydrolase
VRGQAAVAEHRARRLSLLPERRWVHAVRLDGAWVANVHLQGRVAHVLRAASTVLGWAGAGPVVLGGDFNLTAPSVPGFNHAGGHEVDHIFVRDLKGAGRAAVLDRGRLSDHAPVAVTVRPAPRPASGRAPRSPVQRSPPTRR